MKKIIIFILFVLLISSCEDVLDEVPKDFVSRVNYFQTADQAEEAVLGIYDVDLSTPWKRLFIELHSDFAHGRGSWASLNNFDQTLDQTHISRTSRDMWDPAYNIINRCNTVLDNIPGIDMDEDEKNSLLAEAQFNRACAYFDLVRAFGPVPLRTQAITDLSQVDEPRAPVQNIYGLIIADLLNAEQYLPASVGENTRRASKWAAKMVLAQVYLTLENWSEAASKADDVINSGEFSLELVSDTEDFYKIFGNNSNTEYIWSIQFSDTRKDLFVISLHRPNIPAWNNFGAGFYTNLPHTATIIGDSWDDNDLRKSFNLYSEYEDYNGDTVSLPESTPYLFKKYINPDGNRTGAICMLRFSEAYLIFAEAEAMDQGNPSAMALERLNNIRRRAYGYDPFSISPVDYPSGMSLAAFRDSVIRERAYEFINEQRRWWDLKRLNRFKEAIEAAYPGVVYNSAREFLPIPEAEINTNGAIDQSDQNPGY